MPSDSLDTAPAILADTIGSEQQMPAVAHSKRQLRSLLSALPADGPLKPAVETTTSSVA